MHICTLTGVMLEFSSQKHFFVGLLNTPAPPGQVAGEFLLPW